MVTIREIAKDLLNIVRGSNISQSEPISERQLYNWINQYRALLLKRSLDKGSNPNTNYLQSLPTLELSIDKNVISDLIDSDSGYVKEYDMYVLFTKELPKFLTLNTGKAITYVGTADGEEIQYGSRQRSKWQKYRKYSKNEPFIYDVGDKLAVANDTIISYITVTGVFEDPLAVMEFLGQDPLTTEYPIPYNIIPTLKEMVLRNELRIESTAPTDTSNDSEHDINRTTDA